MAQSFNTRTVFSFSRFKTSSRDSSCLAFLEITVIVAKYSHKARRQTQILNTIETATGTSSQGLRKSLQTDR